MNRLRGGEGVKRKLRAKASRVKPRRKRKDISGKDHAIAVTGVLDR